MKILVTGASGFIGAHFIEHILTNTDHTVRALARNSDQRNLKRLQPLTETYYRGLHVIYGDLAKDTSGLCENIDWVVHFAAKTFVDHSIKDAWPFIEANVIGTHNLLEDARRYHVKRYIQVSTDEVYGAILNGAYDENARINPTNPYAASKAGADALTISYAHTYGLHTNVTRTENNYGPKQHPQKAFPVFTKMAMHGQALPVYGDGLHIRQWLYVTDHCTGILKVLESDCPPGDVYHIAGNQELTNIDLAKKILASLGKPEDLINLIPDHDIRPGHDRRYALSCAKLRNLGWSPAVSLDDGIKRTVEWYRDNPWWTE